MNPLDIKIESIKHLMSSRLWNRLDNECVETIGDIMKRADYEWLRVHNFGNRTLRELNGLLSEYGLKLNSRVYKNSLPKPPTKADVILDKIFKLQSALLAISQANNASVTPNEEINDIIKKAMGD